MLIEKGVGKSIMAAEFRHYSDFEIHVVVEGQCTRIFTNKLLLAGFSPVLKIALDAEFSIRKRKKEKTKKKKKKQREEKGPERSCPHANCIAVSPCALYSETTLNTFFFCDVQKLFLVKIEFMLTRQLHSSSIFSTRWKLKFREVFPNIPVFTPSNISDQHSVAVTSYNFHKTSEVI